MNHLVVRNKRWRLYFLLGVVVAVIIGIVYATTDSLKSKAQASARTMIDSAQKAPRPATDRLIASLQQRLRARPEDIPSLANLGSAYLQKARETGDPSYYTRAEKVFQSAIGQNPQSAEALTGMGALCLARHEFYEALRWGQRAIQANSYKAAAYGVAGDAQIELGDYPEAIETIQKMVNLRPDLSSYSRVSYIRELTGDVPGAIEAMKLAVSAGGPALENTNWCRVQLGNLYFNSGLLNAAEQEYLKTLAITPDYAPALFGMARVRAADGKIDEAIAVLEHIVASLPLPEYVIELGDLYALLGHPDQAQEQYDLAQAILQLNRDNGVQIDAELALFQADHDIELPTTVQRARAAMRERPSIVSADVLAWSLYKNGLYVEAANSMKQALRLGTKNALMFFHAGMIHHKLGDHAKAMEFLREAMRINPHFSIRYAPQARTLLDELMQKNVSS